MTWNTAGKAGEKAAGRSTVFLINPSDCSQLCSINSGGWGIPNVDVGEQDGAALQCVHGFKVVDDHEESVGREKHCLSFSTAGNKHPVYERSIRHYGSGELCCAARGLAHTFQ